MTLLIFLKVSNFFGVFFFQALNSFQTFLNFPVNLGEDGRRWFLPPGQQAADGAWPVLHALHGSGLPRGHVRVPGGSVSGLAWLGAPPPERAPRLAVDGLVALLVPAHLRERAVPASRDAGGPGRAVEGVRERAQLQTGRAQCQNQGGVRGSFRWETKQPDSQKARGHLSGWSLGSQHCVQQDTQFFSFFSFSFLRDILVIKKQKCNTSAIIKKPTTNYPPPDLYVQFYFRLFSLILK